MMRIDILSAVPDLLESPLKTSIIKRAQDKGKLSLFIHNTDYANNVQIDDKPSGGPDGLPNRFFKIESLADRNYDTYFTPEREDFQSENCE
jgi:tRNA (guanine37-N1)-methyltransferase